MKTIPVSEMNFPTRMIVGPGALLRLPHEVRNLNASKPLIVSDRGLSATGLVDRTQHLLAEEGIESVVFFASKEGTTEDDVIDGGQLYREKFADLVLGIGGGAVVDLAKLIRLKCTHPLALSTYEARAGGEGRIHANQPSMIAVPTTAGRGSEVGRCAVVRLLTEGRTITISSPHLVPEVAICDAELTRDLPPDITAVAGISALAQALEAYVAIGSNPFADGFALGALARVGMHFVRAVKEGHDLIARHQMMLSAVMSAYAAEKGSGACHALAHALSSTTGLQHGHATAALLPAVIQHNLSFALEAYGVAGTALGAKSARTRVARAHATLERVREMLALAGLPETLRDENLPGDILERAALLAVEDPKARGNPAPFTLDAAKSILEALV